MKVQTKKEHFVDTNSIFFSINENVRDIVRDYDDIKMQGLIVDIRDNGQKDSVILRKLPNGDLHVLRGFRRMFAIRKLLSLYPDGYQELDPDTGKPVIKKFDMVKATIEENLTDEEAFNIMLDHGNVMPLSSVGLHNAMMRSFANGKPEKWIVNSLRGLIDQRYAIPDSKLKDLRDKVDLKLQGIEKNSPRYAVESLKAEEDAYFQYRRGLIQQVNRVFQSPLLVQDAYVKKVRGDQNYPSDADVKELLAVYENERREDKSFTINKANPGPKFLAAWDKIVTSREADESNGTKSKATSMKSRSEVEDMAKNTNSFIRRIDLGIVTRDIPSERSPKFDELCVATEAGMSDELKAQWKDFIATVNVVESVAATAPVAAPELVPA